MGGRASVRVVFLLYLPFFVFPFALPFCGRLSFVAFAFSFSFVSASASIFAVAFPGAFTFLLTFPFPWHFPRPFHYILHPFYQRFRPIGRGIPERNSEV
jgi:hypothetical protein